MNMAAPIFKLNKILFPRLEGSFIRTPTSDLYNQAFRVSVTIISDTKLVLLFGVSLTSDEKLSDKPLVGVIAEAAVEIELTENIVSEVKSLKDIPLAANMLALLFPFLREKVNYFLSNNQLNLLLLPLNTNTLVEDMNEKSGLLISDKRAPIQPKQ